MSAVPKDGENLKGMGYGKMTCNGGRREGRGGITPHKVPVRDGGVGEGKGGSVGATIKKQNKISEENGDVEKASVAPKKPWNITRPVTEKWQADENIDMAMFY